ncbi:MAG TPA: hypothetical protein VMS18_18105 [Candidatus Binatia bacterium]|nr:hypothetical protein [Candidatus Binatia bacterium]
MIDHIEIRLPYHWSVYVARICGRSSRYGFERDFNIRRRREIADFNDGRIKWRVVYYLPTMAAVYEVRDEENERYYVGTRFGDPSLYAVSLARVEALIDCDPDIDEVIGSKIEHFRQSAVQKQEAEGPRRGTNNE